MSRVLIRLEVLITNDYAHHNGWSKGTDVVGKLENGKTTIDDVIAHTEGKVIKVVNYMTGTNKENDRDGMGYGCYVMILHNAKYNNKYVVTLYAHLAKVDPNIREGVYVKRGQRLGVMGNTGNSNGAHLHFEIRLYDCSPVYTALHNKALFTWIDPYKYLEKDLPNNIQGHLDVVSYSEGRLSVAGWTYQGSQNVKVHCCTGATIVKTFTVIANKARPDVQSALRINTSKVGYIMDVAAELKEGKYTIKAYVDGIQLIGEKTITVKNELSANSYSDYSSQSGKVYRVRTTYNNEGTAIGSYRKWQNAYNQWKKNRSKGYHVYDHTGKQLD